MSNTLNPKAAWPFPNATELTDQTEIIENINPIILPQLEEPPPPLLIKDSNENKGGVYKIVLAGRGTDSGIGRITQAQYDFWSHPDNESALGDAMNDPDMTEFENYDGDTVEIPEECRFEYYYNEYSEVACVYGVDVDSCWVSITNPDNEEIYDGDLSGITDRIIDDSDHYFIDCADEHYIGDQDPGHYVYWAQGGKGIYYETEVELAPGEVFDIDKLQFRTEDLESNSVIVTVLYGDEELENDGGSYSGKWADYSVHEVD
jgi:hypothetical protein